MVVGFYENLQGEPHSMHRFVDVYEAAAYSADWPGIASLYQVDISGNMTLLMKFCGMNDPTGGS